jgi:ADP-ribose pyrophosphatase
MRRLVSYWPTAAFANEVIHIYVATGLKAGKPNPDEDEFLSCAAVPLTKLYRDIAAGRIRDSKTLIALMAYRLFGRRR